MLNQLGHLENHVGARAILLGLAVNLEPKTDLVNRGELRLFDEGSVIMKGCERRRGSKAKSLRSDDIPDSSPSIEALGRSPRQSLLFQLFLPISSRYVDGKS